MMYTMWSCFLWPQPLLVLPFISQWKNTDLNLMLAQAMHLNGPFQDHIVFPVQRCCTPTTSTLHCLGAEHAAAAVTDSVDCTSCLPMPREDLLARHLFFVDVMGTTGAIGLFQKQMAILWDKTYICAAQSAAALNNITLISGQL